MKVIVTKKYENDFSSISIGSYFEMKSDYCIYCKLNDGKAIRLTEHKGEFVSLPANAMCNEVRTLNLIESEY